MSWYSRPIQPIDPVVVGQQPKPPIRYFRSDFSATGQNSFVQPPAQDPTQWASLYNIMPIRQNNLKPRWGSNVLTNLAVGGTNRLYNYQSDANGLRAILACAPTNVQAFDQTGTNYLTTLFTPIGGNGGIIRSANSRNFQYFCDGNNALLNHRSGDSLKWDGTNNTSGWNASGSSGVTNIGINNLDVTANKTSGGTTGGTIGPNTGTTAVDVAGPNGIIWNNPSGAFGNSYNTAANCSFIYNNSAGSLTGDTLKMTGFFSSASGTSVSGIQAVFKFSTTLSGFGGIPTRNLVVQLVKNGQAVGNAKTVTAFDSLYGSGNPFTVTLGSSSDTWGVSLTPNDLIQPNFGIQIYVTSSIFSATTDTALVKCAFVQLTATLTGSAGSSSTSGQGVGVVSIVPGSAQNLNLTIGRQYYLVGYNSTTGHFSDLSPFISGTTGPVANSEALLITATYNDPQVDHKYVLATADGGDPSILYQVNVLAPAGVTNTTGGTSGMNITSWQIDGANHVTFTGTYLNGQFKNGATVTVAGLSAGSFMNNATLTVTSTTPTTFVANFTHGPAGPTTEPGVAGSAVFGIPNNATFVVDGWPDTQLVLSQAMVFTDQFGNTFGVALNQPPPSGTLIIKHQGRLWMSGIPGSTHTVYFSKSISELTMPNGFIAGHYEEAWPQDNYFDVSDGAESVSGMLSDGQTLYIGTQNHVRRLIGNSPQTFQLPQIVHPNVGVINQETWQLVFMEGAPAGAIWLTPDYRVIQSDFNTYLDIGMPVQDLLNQIGSNAPTVAHAMFVQDGEFELYILSVPVGNTLPNVQLVYDLRAKQWFTWQFAPGQFAGAALGTLFNINSNGTPQWLFLGGLGTTIGQYSSALTSDNSTGSGSGTNFLVQAITNWLDLGEPTRRKLLNEIVFYGNANVTMSLVGANNQDDFTANDMSKVTGNFRTNSIAYNQTLRQSPFGTWNLYLTGQKTAYRYFQIMFQGTSATTPILGSYSISAQALDDV